AAIDLAARADAHALIAPRILPRAFLGDLERHRLRDVLDREIAGHLPLVAVALGPGRNEPHRGKLLDVEEVRRPQVVVALLLPRVDARGADRDVDLRLTAVGQ